MPKCILQIFHGFIFLGGSGDCVLSPHLFWTSDLFCSSVTSTRHPYYFPCGKLDDSRTLLLLRRLVTTSRHIILVVFRTFFNTNVLSKQCYTLEIVLLDYHALLFKTVLSAPYLYLFEGFPFFARAVPSSPENNKLASRRPTKHHRSMFLRFAPTGTLSPP